MDLSDRLVEHDYWHTARLLEQAATLSDDDHSGVVLQRVPVARRYGRLTA